MSYPPQPGSSGAPGGWNSSPGQGWPGGWGNPNWGNTGQPPQEHYPQGGPQQSGPYPPAGAQYPGPQYPGTQYPGPQGQPVPGPYQVGEGQDFWRQVAAGGPQPRPPRKRRTMWWLLGSIGAGVVLVAAVVITVLATRARDIEAGDCVQLAGEYGGEVSSAECGTDESDYEVVRALDGERPSGCPDTFYNIIGGKTYCVTLDVRVGDCLATYREEKNFMPVSRDCSEPNVDKVTKIANRNDPMAVCPDGQGHYSFATPARTVCFQQNWK